METPDLEMVINEEYSGSLDSKARKENSTHTTFAREKLLEFYSDKTPPCSDVGSDTSYLS